MDLSPNHRNDVLGELMSSSHVQLHLITHKTWIHGHECKWCIACLSFSSISRTQHSKSHNTAKAGVCSSFFIVCTSQKSVALLFGVILFCSPDISIASLMKVCQEDYLIRTPQCPKLWFMIVIHDSEIESTQLTWYSLIARCNGQYAM